jgi:hypothetical protein
LGGVSQFFRKPCVAAQRRPGIGIDRLLLPSIVAIVSSIPAILRAPLRCLILPERWILRFSQRQPSRRVMESDNSELDQMQAAYKAAVEEWIAAIKEEEALASVNHTIAEVDKWEAAHFAEDDIRGKVKAAKKKYEDALREKFFGF